MLPHRRADTARPQGERTDAENLPAQAEEPVHERRRQRAGTNDTEVAEVKFSAQTQKLQRRYMRTFLEKIRKPQKNQSTLTMVLITLGIVLGGFLLGVLQKWIDGSASNVLPDILNQLDIGNYFGRLAIWILLATIISVYAKPL